MTTDRQRIDRWLWHARVVRTRPAAAALASGGRVRLNGARIDAASRVVKAGDVLTVALDRTVRVLRVTGFAERRVSAAETLGLYEDMGSGSGPEAGAKDQDVAAAPAREPGAGRPTKRERRDLDRWLREQEEDQ